MTREKLQRIIENFSDSSPLNHLGASLSTVEENNYAKYNLHMFGIRPEALEEGIPPELKGMRFFQHPILSITRADNPGFTELKRPEVVGAHHLLPIDWLPEAKTVVSIFIPFERATVEANKKDPVLPALEWICTRVDGQRFLLALGDVVKDALIADGFKAVTPSTSDSFIGRGPEETMPPGTEHVPKFSANWSERHVAVVSGLGTFGLSTNFISRAGCAGRLVSVVTDWDTQPDERDYKDWLGYCNRCGACARRCKGEAYCVDGDKIVKDHSKCSAFMAKTHKENRDYYGARYGCGKCQSGIPCEYKPMKESRGSGGEN